jgi:drug/metabolite transporter (DMT)-like permease
LNLKIIHKESFLSWTLIIILSVIWGSSFILIKKGLEAFSPAQVGTLRMSFAFLALLPYALKNIRKLQFKRWKIILLIGFLGNLVPAYLFALAETELKSSLTGILNALTPIFTVIISISIFKNKISFFQIFGLIIAFAGSIGLSFVTDSGDFGNMNLFVWFVVLATIFYSLSLNLIKQYFDDTKAILLTSFSLFSIGPLALVILFSTDFFYRLKTVSGAMESLFYVAILGLAGTAFALILYNRLIRITSAVVASSVTYLIPFIAVIWGLIDGESLYPLHYIGMTITIVGVYIVNKTR